MSKNLYHITNITKKRIYNNIYTNVILRDLYGINATSISAIEMRQHENNRLASVVVEAVSDVEHKKNAHLIEQELIIDHLGHYYRSIYCTVMYITGTNTLFQQSNIITYTYIIFQTKLF